MSCATAVWSMPHHLVGPRSAERLTWCVPPMTLRDCTVCGTWTRRAWSTGHGGQVGRPVRPPVSRAGDARRPRYQARGGRLRWARRWCPCRSGSPRPGVSSPVPTTGGCDGVSGRGCLTASRCWPHAPRGCVTACGGTRRADATDDLLAAAVSVGTAVPRRRVAGHPRAHVLNRVLSAASPSLKIVVTVPHTSASSASATSNCASHSAKVCSSAVIRRRRSSAR